MHACMNIQQVSTLLNIGSRLVNLLITKEIDILWRLICFEWRRLDEKVNFGNGNTTVVFSVLILIIKSI